MQASKAIDMESVQQPFLYRRPSSGSLFSECSIVTVSTFSTAPNLPGPGRTLGNIYDAGGVLLEKHLNKAGEALGIVPSPRVIYQESSSERNLTAPNLPGPGRTLGLLYDALGQILEQCLNRAARRIGLGPSAALERIENRLVKGSPEGMTAIISSSRRKLERDIRKILKYTQSDVRETQRQAIECIISLTVSDQIIRCVLLQMGALRYLIEFEPCASACCPANRDPLLADSRKALISLTDTRVHAIGQKILSVGWGSGSWGEEHSSPYHDMIAFVRDPEVAFIALRYLVKQRDVLEELVLGSDEYRFEFSRAAQHAFFYGYDMDWPLIDDLLVLSLAKDFFNWDYGGSVSDVEGEKNSMIIAVKLCLLVPDKLPRSMEYLIGQLGYPNESDFAFDYLMDWKRLVYRHIALLSLGSSLLEDISHISSSALSLCHLALHKSDELDDHLARIIQECSSWSDVICRAVGVEPVADYLVISTMVSDMMSCFKRSSKKSRIMTVMARNLKVLRTLNRYVWKAIRDYVYSDQELMTDVNHAWIIDLVSNLEQKPNSGLPTKKLHRRKRLQLMRRFDTIRRRHQFSERNMSNDGESVKRVDKMKEEAIFEKAFWWPPSSEEPNPLHRGSSGGHLLSPEEERLELICETVLLMDIPPGQSFRASGHYPIYSGIDRSGRGLYLGIAVLPSSISAWRICVVPEGSEHAEYWIRGKRKLTDHFKVFVSRFDLDDYPVKYLAQVNLFGGIDATGPVCWWNTHEHMNRTSGMDGYTYWK